MNLERTCILCSFLNRPVHLKVATVSRDPVWKTSAGATPLLPFRTIWRADHFWSSPKSISVPQPPGTSTARPAEANMSTWNPSPNQKQIVVPTWQLKSFTSWGSIHGCFFQFAEHSATLGLLWPRAASEAATSDSLTSHFMDQTLVSHLTDRRLVLGNNLKHHDLTRSPVFHIRTSSSRPVACRSSTILLSPPLPLSTTLHPTAPGLRSTLSATTAPESRVLRGECGGRESSRGSTDRCRGPRAQTGKRSKRRSSGRSD